ncbi:hypothetical protein BDR07DRAFT_1423748 [Suillus spraguei]|nr:hypothetical protein BDR07DRAFT_1423748 [Suillus spraguei]
MIPSPDPRQLRHAANTYHTINQSNAIQPFAFLSQMRKTRVMLPVTDCAHNCSAILCIHQTQRLDTTRPLGSQHGPTTQAKKTLAHVLIITFTHSLYHYL